MNHQDIADRREALHNEKSRALEAEEARLAKEVESLQELCGGMGHIYINERSPFRFFDPAHPVSRVCAACGKSES